MLLLLLLVPLAYPVSCTTNFAIVTFSLSNWVLICLFPLHQSKYSASSATDRSDAAPTMDRPIESSLFDPVALRGFSRSLKGF